ncbi:three-helix bundle dimerization domain-containing protein [Rhodococcoides yunnanense]|uniref:Protein-tyrosine-phosphatase-like N-terminal domain-containing protein n=1 Tax=Rhodococcoides yunnanense TaxID=278209 RepID=A0ABU4B6W5_9NOCA|nr:hypothetical protein [Rhodococcus yunnanensis]MDV6259933.1 hypothetical protein [Rhodococcus yunnanensis]
MTIADARPTTRLLNDELTSIATMLASRFPDLTRATVENAVRTTYDRLDTTARVRGHLIPLTSNRARVELDRLLAEHGIDDDLESVSAEIRRALPPMAGRSW